MIMQSAAAKPNQICQIRIPKSVPFELYQAQALTADLESVS